VFATTRKTPLAEKLAARIAKEGAITFADYMDACLYDPEFGYYSSGERAQGADYYTSVEVHPIFAKLIARQLDEMWRTLDRPKEFIVAELGAGSGALASQILDFTAAHLSDLRKSLRYVTIEKSAARRQAQAKSLDTHLSSGRAQIAESLPAKIYTGCVLSNEFFDALPVHRVEAHKKELKEICVGHAGDRFVEELHPPSDSAITSYFVNYGAALREEQQAEAGLAACDWIRSAGARLERGFVLTIDYGHDARELYNERHMRGTMLAYRGHAAGENFYDAPGEQDLTAHVNFTALDLAGKESGLETTGRVSQTQFLLALARKNNFADLHEANHDTVSSLKGRLKFKTLIHPEGMGETFQVQIQQKGITNAKLSGLEPL
jgi:SAM-dependent MidA family methyltransferase